MINIIEQLNRFLEEASVSARINWGVKFLELRPLLLSALKGSKKGIDTPGYPTNKLDIFLNILKQEEVSDLDLLGGLESLEEIFTLSQIKDEEVGKFKVFLTVFRNRVKNEDNFRSLRSKLLRNMPPEKCKEYDLKLFNNEGMNYCLVYYVAFFKALTDLKTADEKIRFIKAEEVKLENGGLPGIKQDFKNDESLNKFILLISDDSTRDALVDLYYDCKEIILKSDDPEVIQSKLKEYIYELILAFEKQGIVRLSSHFFTPYGADPLFKDLLSIFRY